MTIFSLIYFFVGCDSKSIKKTYTTNYGDTFIVTAELHIGMHNDSIDYHITGVDLAGEYLYYDNESNVLPNNPESDIVEIISKDQVNLYSLKDGLFYVFNKKISKLPSEYNLDYYLTMEDFPDEKEKMTFLFVIQTLVQCKRLKYIERFAPVLIYENDTETISLIQNWASGIFTEEEVQINAEDGYSTEDLQQWAIGILQTADNKSSN